MNRLLICLLLTGCATAVPVAQKFPEVPVVLTDPPPMLKPLTPGQHELSDMLENINENYGTYYETRIKLLGWQSWYTKQKEIFDKIQE